MPLSSAQEMILGSFLYNIGVDRLSEDEPNGFLNVLSESSKSTQFPEFVAYARGWLAEAVAIRDRTRDMEASGRKAFRDTVLRTLYGIVGDDLEAACLSPFIAQKARLEFEVVERALGFLAHEGLVKVGEHPLPLYSITYEGLKVMEEVEAQEAEPTRRALPALGAGVFVGHGGSPLYHQVMSHVRDRFGVEIHTFERHFVAGSEVIPTLQKMVDLCGYAVIVATGEDAAEGGLRARQNVVHEIGLFQGRLGFNRVVVLMQRGVETLSNLSGLLYIPFSGDRIEEAFAQLDAALANAGYRQP